MDAIYLTVLCIVWGTTWTAIKIGLDYFPPMYFLLGRFLLSAVILFGMAQLMGAKKLKSLRDYLPPVIFGLFMGIDYYLIYYGEQYISSGLTSVLFSVMPFFGIFLSRVYLKKQLKVNEILGALLGFIGILIIFGNSLVELKGSQLLPQLAIVASALAAAFGTAYMEKHPVEADPIYIVAVQMATVNLVPLVFGVWMDWGKPLVFSWQGMTALVYLAVFGTCLSFVMYYKLLNKDGTTLVTYIPLVTPIVAILAGTLFLQEKITIAMIGGLILILVGLFILKNKKIQQKLNHRRRVVRELQ